MTWDSRKQRAFGWAYLLGITAFYAVLNLGGIGLLLAPLEPLFRPESAADNGEPELWQLALGWRSVCPPCSLSWPGGPASPRLLT